MQAANLDSPGRGAGVETGFAEPLKDARQARAGNAKRQQISNTGERAACESGQEGDFAAARIGQGAGDETAPESDEAEDTDDQADRLVGAPEIVPDVRSERGQHGADAEKSEEGCGNETPKACAESGREKTHEA
jgi:hypothetical protein